MTAILVLTMTITGGKSESGISLEKVESGNVLTEIFGDLGMIKNNKWSIDYEK